MQRRTVLKALAVGWSPVALLGRAGPATADDARVLVAAGDLNHRPDAIATGRRAVAHRPDLVATVGDQQYPDGSLEDYRAKYGTTPWASLKQITRPVPGHHEYDTPRAAGYFAYFGVPSHYAYAIGAGWRGYALNSHVDVAEQAAWLRRDLARHPGADVVAAWSDPLRSSGTKHGGDRRMQAFWDALAGRRGIVLNGHEHHYERFARRDGLRQFVVGTGGSATYPFGPPVAGSEVRIDHVPGILVLRLERGGGSRWRFEDSTGRTRDEGRD